mmetsp:Transcript_8914/g.25685  ORF Transcript_8914/g.25685 Transcript_8914/m.25685 type:complete len:214 (-) Transcript_8914:1595-2236(-)
MWELRVPAVVCGQRTADKLTHQRPRAPRGTRTSSGSGTKVCSALSRQAPQRVGTFRTLPTPRADRNRQCGIKVPLAIEPPTAPTFSRASSSYCSAPFSRQPTGIYTRHRRQLVTREAPGQTDCGPRKPVLDARLCQRQRQLRCCQRVSLWPPARVQRATGGRGRQQRTYRFALGSAAYVPYITYATCSSAGSLEAVGRHTRDAAAQPGGDLLT